MAMGLPALAQPGPRVPDGYPGDYADVIARAQREGGVTVYASTDLEVVQPLIQGFEARYPGVRVRYQDLNTLELHERFLAESAGMGPAPPSRDAAYADVLWSTTMDLQIKLVNDGHAQRYESPERPGLPSWAVWRDEAWGTTFEPAVIVYNRKHFASAHVPGSRSGLARLLQEHAPQWRGKVVTYDVERSGVGYLLAQQDARMGNEFWYLAQALGRAQVQMSASTADMVERIASGELVLGYNLLGSYALSLMERGAGIGVIAPRDYTLVMSRVAFIARRPGVAGAVHVAALYHPHRYRQCAYGQCPGRAAGLRAQADQRGARPARCAGCPAQEGLPRALARGPQGLSRAGSVVGAAGLKLPAPDAIRRRPAAGARTAPPFPGPVAPSGAARSPRARPGTGAAYR